MTMTTDLTPLLKHLKLGAMLNTLPERIALAAGSNWTTPPSSKSSSATRSTAGPTGASRRGCTSWLQ